MVSEARERNLCEVHSAVAAEWRDGRLLDANLHRDAIDCGFSRCARTSPRGTTESAPLKQRVTQRLTMRHTRCHSDDLRFRPRFLEATRSFGPHLQKNRLFKMPTHFARYDQQRGERRYVYSNEYRGAVS
jgi:hypothetical protein